MRAVKLQYLGKTEVLKITQPHLSRHYTFDKKTGSVDLVLYEDAKIMLEEGPKAFKVISGIIEVGPEHFEPVEQNFAPSPPPPPPPLIEPEKGEVKEPFPEDAVTDPTPVEPEPILTGDGVEGTGDMPPIEEPPKKGGKKGNK